MIPSATAELSSSQFSTPAAMSTEQVEASPNIRDKSPAGLCNAYPELSWLADDAVIITQENVASTSDSPSIQLFSKKFPEFDRTLLTLKALDCLLEGRDEHYESFTEAQGEASKLTRDSFDKLHREAQSLCESLELGDEAARALETALVLGDMGKTQNARTVFPSITTPDHDDFEAEAMGILEHQPDLCPSFRNCSQRARDIIREAVGLIHFGHVYHLEGGAEMFSALKGFATRMQDDPDRAKLIFRVADFVNLCDVAGALGHVNPNSSIVFTEDTFRGYECVRDACHLILDGGCEEEALQLQLQRRAEVLGLDPENAGGKANFSARLGSMLRLFSKDDGVMVLNALDQLQERGELDDIIEQLSLEDCQKSRLTPTYMPAVLNNLLGNKALGETREVRFEKAITLGLPVIAKAVALHREKANTTRLCFNTLAGQAKTIDSCRFAQGDLNIDSDGNVTLAFRSLTGLPV